MITFDADDLRFNYRTAAVALHEGRVLLHQVEGKDYWSMPGGRVELMESSREAVRRELEEELHVKARVERLLWFVENFFRHEGMRYHELATFFLVSFPPESGLYEREGYFYGEDQGMRLIFEWRDVADLPGMNLYPSFLREGLADPPPTPRYVVHEDEPADTP